jgi:hypothetical protein
MNPVVRNILAFVVGLIVGSVVNSMLVSLNGVLIPFPEGVDVTSMEGLAASMSLFKPIHFLMPFLGHAIGTFVGAYIVAKYAASHGDKLAYFIGLFFLGGGIYMVTQLPSPMWFNILDVLVAYIPMSYLAIKMASKYK